MTECEPMDAKRSLMVMREWIPRGARHGEREGVTPPLLFAYSLFAANVSNVAEFPGT